MLFARLRLPQILLFWFGVSGLFLPTARTVSADDPSPETKALIAKLREDMKSKTVATRVTAYKSMGEFGDKAKSQRRALCEGMLDTNQTVRTAAADALKKVDEPMYKLAIGVLIDKNNRDIVAIGKLGAAGEPLTPLVLSYATSAVPVASMKSLDSTHERARDALRVCIDTLAAVAPEDEGVNKAVIAMLGNPHPELRAHALKHIAALKNKKQALKGALALAGSLTERATVRADAVKLLPLLVDENTGPATKKALETLRFDNSEAVREAVAKSIEAIK